MKIIGIGNALVDIMTPLPSDALLHEFKLPKGSMTLVEEALSNTLREATLHIESTLTAGGSACNTISGLAHLGTSSAFIGAVADDAYGDFYKKALEGNGVIPLLFDSKRITGRAVALVSPDSERTFATHLGAAIDIPLEKITPAIFNGYDILHIEGYLVYNHDLITKAIQSAKDAGLLVSIDLASFNVVNDNLAFLKEIVSSYVDICFANEEEALSFTGKEPYEALDQIAENCSWAIVKMGKKGSCIKHHGEVTRIAPIPAEPLDTTGAGDLYAAGFLHGLANGWEMKRCGETGALLAGKVIEIYGARIPESTWATIRSLIGKEGILPRS
ncbi:MAG: adenosine kinase [Bacteroidetes bacterium]|nr:MAG: adenosine kinase [Bacteroidota bacterium]